jgi:hypothetical protein
MLKCFFNGGSESRNSWTMTIFIHIFLMKTKYVCNGLLIFFHISFKGLRDRVISKNHLPLSAVGSTHTRGVELFMQGPNAKLYISACARNSYRVRT